jgi:hypothetical protein
MPFHSAGVEDRQLSTLESSATKQGSCMADSPPLSRSSSLDSGQGSHGSSILHVFPAPSFLEPRACVFLQVFSPTRSSRRDKIAFYTTHSRCGDGRLRHSSSYCIQTRCSCLLRGPDIRYRVGFVRLLRAPPGEGARRSMPFSERCRPSNCGHIAGRAYL